MSILDRAKKQLEERLRGVGEETIRVMDEVNEDPKNKERKPKPVPRSKPVVKESFKPEKEKFSFKNKIFTRPSDDVSSDEKPIERTVKKTVQPEPETPQSDEDYAFDYDDAAENAYFENMGKKHKEKMKAYEKVPVPLVDEGKIQDILELIKVPATFEIDSDIYLPDDLNDIAFDMQVPQGYETSEVDTFVSRARISIAKYVELLTIRNEHVAKLATVIDRLQVDVSNMKLESEIANGINIMPTHDTENIEQENFELKSLVKRLEEQLESNSRTSDNLTSKEREIFEQLQDEVSLKNRKIEELKEELYRAKTSLSALEESQDQESYFPQEQENGHSNYQEEDYSAEDSIDALPDLGGSTNDLLPDTNFDSSAVSDLPDLGDELFESPNSSYEPSVKSAFEEDEESIEDFLMRNQSYYQNEEEDSSSISVLDDNGSSYESSRVGTYYDDDEEDELDKLQNWGHN